MGFLSLTGQGHGLAIGPHCPAFSARPTDRAPFSVRVVDCHLALAGAPDNDLLRQGGLGHCRDRAEQAEIGFHAESPVGLKFRPVVQRIN